MAKQTIGVGTSANDGTGDTLRAAMQKANANFTELYDADVALASDIGDNASDIASLGGSLSSLSTTVSGKQNSSSNLTDFSAKTAPSGAVVGTTDSQTLTNKAINGADNSLTVRLANDVSGRLPFANLAQLSALSVLGVTGNSAADGAAIAAAASGQFLRRDGNAIGFGGFPVTTYASLPAAASSTGLVFYVSDVGLMISDGTNWLQLSSISTVWASRGTPLFSGQTKRFTDVGLSGATMRSIGTSGVNDWRITTPVILHFDATFSSYSLSTSEQIARQVNIPAGLLLTARTMYIRATWSKTNTTESMTGRFRLGTAGTTADTQIGNFLLSTANRVNPQEMGLAFVNTTDFKRLGNHGAGAMWSGLPTTTAMTTGDISGLPAIDSNALVLSFTVQQSGATTTPQLGPSEVELRP